VVPLQRRDLQNLRNPTISGPSDGRRRVVPCCLRTEGKLTSLLERTSRDDRSHAGSYGQPPDSLGWGCVYWNFRSVCWLDSSSCCRPRRSHAPARWTSADLRQADGGAETGPQGRLKRNGFWGALGREGEDGVLQRRTRPMSSRRSATARWKGARCAAPRERVQHRCRPELTQELPHCRRLLAIVAGGSGIEGGLSLQRGLHAGSNPQRCRAPQQPLHGNRTC